MCNNCNPCKYNKNNICENKNLLFYQLPTENICEGCGAYEPTYKKEDCVWYHKEEEGLFTNPDTCALNMPDSLNNCNGICSHFCFESKTPTYTIPSADNTPAYQQVKRDTEELTDKCIKVIEGVGKDAEIITNENGGKQSKTPMALHLVTPEFIQIASDDLPKSNIKNAIDEIITFMATDKWYVIDHLFEALKQIEPDKIQQIFEIGKVMQEGADRYEPNNWRLIPQEIHINHALIHLFAAALGDTQDNHLDHALCRLMFACNTEPSSSFSYTKYKGKSK